MTTTHATGPKRFKAPRRVVRRARGARRSPSLQVALDGALVANARVLGVAPDLAQRAALAQQVPGLVELDLDLLEALAVRGQRLALVVLFLAAQVVLLGHEPLDPRADALVAHLRSLVACLRSSSRTAQIASACTVSIHISHRPESETLSLRK